jgi:DNA polymerase elongation subunit (family B)
MKRVAFDIETEPFSEEFLHATSETEKTKYAPKMRLACLYDEKSDSYNFFMPENSDQLISILKECDEIISFNGKNFDILVLQQHYGLDITPPINGSHIDMHEIMSKLAGFRVSLDKAAQLNLGEKKHTNGRSMAELDINQLKVACQSDVTQTYKLWQLYNQGNLKNPRKKPRDIMKIISPSSCGDIGPGHHMPNECPTCGDVASLEFVCWDTDDMSEGQLSDYSAGLYGSCICTSCGEEFDWGF